MAWLDAKTVTEEGTEATCDQKHSTLEGNLLDLKNGSRRSLGDAAGLPVFAKEDSTPHKPSHRTLQKQPIKRISGKLGHREQRNRVNGGTTPRGCL